MLLHVSGVLLVSILLLIGAMYYDCYTLLLIGNEKSLMAMISCCKVLN